VDKPTWLTPQQAATTTRHVILWWLPWSWLTHMTRHPLDLTSLGLGLIAIGSTLSIRRTLKQGRAPKQGQG
jgi:hypothetical protein